MVANVRTSALCRDKESQGQGILPSILLADDIAFVSSLLSLCDRLELKWNEMMVASGGMRTHGLLAFNNQLVHLVELTDNRLPL